MLKGKKITLRAIEVDDYTFFHRWINNPETNKWRGVYDPMNVEKCAQYLEELQSPSDLTLMITHDDKPIGLIGLKSICMRSRRAELWIYIGELDCHNKGFGRDAISLLCQYAFEQKNLHRIWLELDASYAAAIKCYENCGFMTEGILRDGYFRHGAYRNTMIMGLIRNY